MNWIIAGTIGVALLIEGAVIAVILARTDRPRRRPKHADPFDAIMQAAPDLRRRLRRIDRAFHPDAESEQRSKQRWEW